MLEWLSVALLVGVGLTLITIELIFVPGTTILGIVGLVCLVVGVFLSFQYFGTGVGWTVLLGSSAIGFGTLTYALRSGVWDRFANKSSIDSHFNEDFPNNLQVGQVGEAVSALRPVGKAEFDTRLHEVRSDGNYIPTGKKLQVIRIVGSKVFVEAYQNENKSS